MSKGTRLAGVMRWVLVPVAGYAGWTIALWAGFAMESVATGLCPDQLMVSGMCGAKWYGFAIETITCISAALAAALIVALCTFTAPYNRRMVARVTFIVGAAV